MANDTKTTPQIKDLEVKSEESAKVKGGPTAVEMGQGGLIGLLNPPPVNAGLLVPAVRPAGGAH